jgi:prepilin-type N-terminal cleavage/methylation domain-containing protein
MLRTPYSHSAKNCGFSLVELSIVLVILGLLTGGILTGQSLIRAAELRSITTEYNNYVVSVYTFKQKYFALPGDISNATQFWGEADNDPATCSTTASLGKETCNGNGDGMIVGWPPDSIEIMRAWQHLANAGLINGTYTGIGGPANDYHCVPNVNSPEAKLSGGGYSFAYRGERIAEVGYFDGSYGNVIEFGAANPWKSCDDPILMPEESWNLDKKLDDGKPGRGKIRTYTSDWFPNCVDGTSLDADYRLNNEVVSCNLLFSTGF